MQLNEQLSQIGQSLSGMVPELFLAGFLLVFLVAELLLRRRGANADRVLSLLGMAGALVALGLVVGQWDDPPSYRFPPLLLLDKKAVFFKFLALGGWLFALAHMRLLRYRFPPELHALLIAAALALCLLSMAIHWLSVYLALELLSLSSYLMVALSPTRKAAEGALKYLLFGAVSSAVMLYGISLIYGLTGTLSFTNATIEIGLANNPPLVMQAAMLMALGGLLFKFSLVPFHVWTPDVYEAAPTPLVSFLSVAPKVAVLLVLVRTATAFPIDFLPLLGGIALLSITVGNVAALWQQNARRLLAYSSIAQAGYLVVGIVAYSPSGFEAATFYVAAYLLLNMAAFLLVDLLAPGSDTALSDYEGLGRTQGWVAVALTVVLVALAGLPPTVGFTAKWLVFSALWDAYQQNSQTWMLWLFVGGILNAGIALAYYLRLPYLLFFKKTGETFFPETSLHWGKYLSVFVLLAVLLLFFKPELLLGLIGGI